MLYVPVYKIGVDFSRGKMRVMHHYRLIGSGMFFEIIRDSPLHVLLEESFLAPLVAKNLLD